MARVSVLIPSRQERFLEPTWRDVLAKARGDIEVVVVLDGYWPEWALPNDTRVRVLHRGQAQGMRPALTAAAHLATGDYLLKIDAHVMLAEGFDVQLLADYHESNWVLVPRRYALDPVAWAIDESNPKYPVDAHYLSNPFATPANSTPGLHGSDWRARRDARADVLLDDELSSQGSCWFMSRAQWNRLGGLDAQRYGSFWHEFQEIGLKTWLSGGAVKVTKRTWYAHLFKGKTWGRGYSLTAAGHEQGSAFCAWFWMTDQPFVGRTRTLQSLIEQFAPVPTWPADLETVFALARARLTDPYAAHAFDWPGYCAALRGTVEVSA